MLTSDEEKERTRSSTSRRLTCRWSSDSIFDLDGLVASHAPDPTPPSRHPRSLPGWTWKGAFPTKTARMLTCTVHCSGDCGACERSFEARVSCRLGVPSRRCSSNATMPLEKLPSLFPATHLQLPATTYNADIRRQMNPDSARESWWSTKPNSVEGESGTWSYVATFRAHLALRCSSSASSLLSTGKSYVVRR